MFGIKNFSFTTFFVCFSFQMQQHNSFLFEFQNPELGHNANKAVTLEKTEWKLSWNNAVGNTAWKVSKYVVFSGPHFPVFGLNTERFRIPPYSVQLRENTDQKTLPIWTLFTQWNYVLLGTFIKQYLVKIHSYHLVRCLKCPPSETMRNMALCFQRNKLMT